MLAELNEIVESYGTERRSEIISPEDIPVYEAPTESDADFDPDSDEACVVTVSTSGKLGRSPVEGAKRASPGRHDLLSARVLASTAASVVAVTTEGRAVTFRGADAADAAGRTRGGDVAQLLGLNRGESVLDLVVPGEEIVVLVTANGVAKRLTTDEVLATRSGKTIIGLKNNDRVVAAFRAPEKVDMVIVSSDGQTLRLPASSVSVQGRGAGGVAGMKLKPGATVVGAGALIGDGSVITATSASGVKATPYGELPTKGRGGQGVRIAKLADGEIVTTVYVGVADGGVLTQMASDDDPKKLDPNPEVLEVEDSNRDLVPTRTERQIMVLAPGRW